MIGVTPLKLLKISALKGFVSYNPVSYKSCECNKFGADIHTIVIVCQKYAWWSEVCKMILVLWFISSKWFLNRDISVYSINYSIGGHYVKIIFNW